MAKCKSNFVRLEFTSKKPRIIFLGKLQVILDKNFANGFFHPSKLLVALVD